MLRSFVKIGAAGATVFAIGWGMLVLTPDPDEPVEVVKKADADIAAFSFAAQSQQAKFVETILDEGMEKPRAYDHNGNTLFFSTTTTKESPRQVLERFQRAFVDKGVNEHVHLRPPRNATPEDIPSLTALFESQQARDKAEPFFADRKKYLDDFVGGVVPAFVQDDRVFMVGTTTDDDAEDGYDWAMEVAKELKANPNKEKRDLSDGMKAMRYIDAHRERNRTRISAVWSDENYSAGKIADITEPGNEDLNVDPDVPMCTGCKRLMQFTGLSEDEYTTTAIDAGHMSVEQVLTYYKRSLTQRGWQLSETAKVLRAAEMADIKPESAPKMIQFARGENQFMIVTAWPDTDGKTNLTVSKSD